MSGVEGYSPRLSLGDSKGVFSSEREYPLWCRGAHAAPPPALARENQDTVVEAAKANEKVAKAIAGMQIVKVIHVKNKLVNLIVKPC